MTERISRSGLRLTNTFMTDTLVVIPYCQEGKQGRELEYAIAGWRRHFKEDCTIVLVGDFEPWADVYLPCPRIEHSDDGNYLPHLDHVHKFLEVLKLFPHEGFIYACDDMYAVKDFTLDDVKALKYLEDDMYGSLMDPNAWNRDEAKTRNLCVQNGLETRNFVCHLPVYYERDKLMAVYKEFDCEHNSCVVEDVYFNKYYAGLPARHADEFRLGLNSADVPEETIRGAIDNKIWITNSPLGWSKTLDKVLNEHYYGK